MNTGLLQAAEHKPGLLRLVLRGTRRSALRILGLLLAGLAGSFIAGTASGAPSERLRNEKVLVLDQSLQPGETMLMPGNRAGVLVWFNAGEVTVSSAGGAPRTETVKRGEVVFRPAESGTFKNAGATVLRVIWTGFLGQGGQEFWGTNGLAPDYRLLFENQYGRAYDIRIKAGEFEPRHTHHDRIVICLSGAELEHTLLDGRKEPATLNTGQITWRRGVTHIGHNLGKTDLWVIAIEPK
jgi:hypothetical protein